MQTKYEVATVVCIAVAFEVPIVLFFNPQLSEEFLFLYFGVASALATAVWSTLVLAGPGDKETIHLSWTLFGGAAIASLGAALFGPKYARLPLDVSVDYLLTGIIFLFYHAYKHTDQYGLARRVEQVARRAVGLDTRFRPHGPRADTPLGEIVLFVGEYLVCDIEIRNTDTQTRRIGGPAIEGYPHLGLKFDADQSPAGFALADGTPLSRTDPISVSPTTRRSEDVVTGGGKPLLLSIRYRAIQKSSGLALWYKMIEPGGRVHQSRTFQVRIDAAPIEETGAPDGETSATAR